MWQIDTMDFTMLAIKLRPVGKKKQRSFRIVVMEKRSKLVGKFIEDLGWYNPHTNESRVNNDRISYWIEKGAQPTDSIHNILVTKKAIEGSKIAVHAKNKKAPAPEPAKEAQETPQTQEEPSSDSSPEALAKEESSEKEEVPVQEESKKEEIVPEPKEDIVEVAPQEETKEESTEPEKEPQQQDSSAETLVKEEA